MQRRQFIKMTGSLAMLATAGSALSACSGDGDDAATDVGKKSSGSMDAYKVGDTFKAAEAITFPLLFSDQPTYPYKKDWMLFTKTAELTNVTFDCTIVPMSDYEQKRSLLIASGDAPLIIPKTYPGQESPFVSSGAILPVSDYVKEMPHFQDKVKKWKLEPELASLAQEDGKYYVLPGLHEALWPDYTLCFRMDLLEKHGIETPKTWDEVKSALQKLKQAHPDATPFSDRFTGSSTLNIAGPAFGTAAGWGFGTGLSFDKDKDSFSYAPAGQPYRDLVTYFHSLVKEGLMDKESFTQDDEQAQQKFVSGKSFVINTNSQTINDYRTALDKTIGKGKYEIAKIVVPGGPAGDMIGGSRLENGIMLSAQAAEGDSFKAMLQFIDWFWYSDAGNEFTKWGVEDVTFTKDGSGKRTLTDDYTYNGLNPEGKKDLRIDAGFSGGVFAYGGTTELLHSMMLPEELEFQEAMKSKTPVPIDPPTPFGEAKKEQVTLITTPLKDYVDQHTLKFILGQRDLSEYDAFIKELDGKGMTKYTDLANEAYQNYKKT